MVTETGDEVDKWKVMEREGLCLPDTVIEGNITEIFDAAALDHVAFILQPDTAEASGPLAEALRVSDLAGLTAGHEID